MTQMKPTNETIIITIGSPLLRPGLTLSASVSKRYAADAAQDLLTIARAINDNAAKPFDLAKAIESGAFLNKGEQPNAFDADLNCPYCGGSGHKDDASAPSSKGVDSHE